MSKYFAIANSQGQLISKWGYESAKDAALFENEADARKLVSNLYLYNIKRRACSQILGIRVVEIDIDPAPTTKEHEDSIRLDITRALIANRLSKDIDECATSFWLHLIKLGIADAVTHICDANPNTNSYSGVERQKEFRASVRSLGLKANQYRMSGDFMAFFNKDDAFNAKMCLNFKHFIDFS